MQGVETSFKGRSRFVETIFFGEGWSWHSNHLSILLLLQEILCYFYLFERSEHLLSKTNVSQYLGYWRLVKILGLEILIVLKSLGLEALLEL